LRREEPGAGNYKEREPEIGSRTCRTFQSVRQESYGMVDQRLQD